MNNTCPSCGAVYNVASKDIGRRIKCKKCGAALTVTDAGLELDSAPAPAPDIDDAPDEPRPRARSRSSGGSPFSGAMLADFGGLPTILFTAGSFLVIVCMFMPIIDMASVKSRQADLDQQRMDYNRANEALVKEGKTPDSKVLENQEKKLKELQESVDKAKISQNRQVFNQYGMMLGFILVMVGSIGFMMPSQSTTRRVVGAIVLCAQLVFIIIEFVIVSAASSFR